MEPSTKRRCTQIDTCATKMFNWWFKDNVDTDMARLLLSQNVTVQQLHTSPNVYIIDNFLTNAEILKLGKFIDRLSFNSSTVYTSDGQEEVSNYKTSSSAPLPNTSTSTEIIYRKIRQLMPNVAFETPLQVLEYKIGQKCEMHHDGATIEYDYYDDNSSLKLVETDEKYKRIMTGFLYLSSIENGGSTYFPLLNLNVKAVAGRLLLFPDILDTQTLKMDPQTIHEAQPVQEGIKRGINIWFLNKHPY